MNFSYDKIILGGTMEVQKRKKTQSHLRQANTERPFLSETLPDSFSLYTLVAMGLVAVLASLIVMSVLLQIVWHANPMFVL